MRITKSVLLGLGGASVVTASYLTLTSCVSQGEVPDVGKFSWDSASGLVRVVGQCIDTHDRGEFCIPYIWECISNENQVFDYDANSGKLSLMPNKELCLAAVHGFPMLLDCESQDPSLKLVFQKDGQLYIPAVDKCVQVTSSLNMKSCQDDDLKDFPYCNSNLSPSVRAKDLVSRMTTSEKLANTINDNPGVPRLGVPPFVFGEALHGIVSECGKSENGNTGCPTSFPHALALSATFNSSLWYNIGHAIGLEGRALINQGIGGMAYWAPDINLFRDPRWGRGQEVPGEDPFLTGEYGIAYIRGIQFGDDPNYLQGIATAKHFADYDIEGNLGIDRGTFDAVVSKKDQVEYYWPQWRAVIRGANVQSMMCSYNSINGVPACGNNLFMNEVARKMWGFDGYIVSDCGAINDPAYYRYVEKYMNGSYDESIKYGMQSGCDLNCGNDYFERGVLSYFNNVLTDDVLDTVLTRIYSGMIKLGYLDDPKFVSYRHIGPEVVDSAEHRALSLEAAVQGMVLLKNEQSLLPLSRTAKIALIGPHANASIDMISIYHGDVPLTESHTPLLSLIKAGANVVGYEQGCDLTTTGITDFTAATSLASKADVAVVVVGLHPGQDFEPAREDEGYDRSSIGFPGSQLSLVKAILAVNPRTVVVMINGGLISSSYIKENVPSIIQAWYPGELGGDALSAILLGDVSPSGKLPITFYHEDFVSERPIDDMSLLGGNGITYRYYKKTPLWNFGFGLSYSTFTHVLVEGTSVASTDSFLQSFDEYFQVGGTVFGKFFSPARYSVEVTNSGKVCGADVILGFLTSSHKDAPLKELFGYQRVNLCPGEKATVTLHLPPSVLSLIDDNGIETLRPGNYEVHIGDTIKHSLEIVGDIKTLFVFPAEI